jgi:hypothetical protein
MFLILWSDKNLTFTHIIKISETGDDVLSIADIEPGNESDEFRQRNLPDEIALVDLSDVIMRRKLDALDKELSR